MAHISIAAALQRDDLLGGQVQVILRAGRGVAARWRAGKLRALDIHHGDAIAALGRTVPPSPKP